MVVSATGYDLKSLYDRIFEQQGKDPVEKAATIVYKRLLDDPDTDHKALWAEIGEFALIQLEYKGRYEGWHHSGLTVHSASPNAPSSIQSGVPYTVAAAQRDLLDYVWPVGKPGSPAKRIGDWTKQDFLYRKEMYDAIIRGDQKKADACEEIAKLVPRGKTLRQV